MRLVDADELKTAFPCGESVRTESVRATIDHMATVDAVEVVGCKDCRYYDAESHNCLDELGYARVWEEDDYCSFAERKNDATND